MTHFLWSLPYPNKDAAVIKTPDPLIVGGADPVIGRDASMIVKSMHPDSKRGKTRAAPEAAPRRP